MYIKRVKLENFRNYDNLDIEFTKDFNLIYGNNAQGKTNILEAIYISALRKIFSNKKRPRTNKTRKRKSKSRNRICKKRQRRKNHNRNRRKKDLLYKRSKTTKNKWHNRKNKSSTILSRQYRHNKRRPIRKKKIPRHNDKPTKAKLSTSIKHIQQNSWTKKHIFKTN